MMILAWVLVTARLVFTAADLQRKSVSPMPVVELESKQERTQTINTAPTHSHATELTKFRQEILGAHNFKRQLHKVPLLTEDIKLDKQAQSFAVKLAIQGNITHSPLRDRIGQGENIALRCALKAPISVLTGRRATNLWYNESKKFTWSIKALTPATQRFTQMVWKNTSKAGFGRAKFVDKDGKTCFVVVARYAPAGNEKGKLMDNVFRSNNGTTFKPNVPRGTPM